MPSYRFLCECGHETEDICSIKDRVDEIACEKCGKMAPRNYMSKNASVCHSEKEMLSWAMAVNPDQIPAAMKKWPGSRYDPVTGQLKMKGRTERKVRMKQRGFVDYEGFN